MNSGFQHMYQYQLEASIKNFRQRTFQHNQNALNAIMPHAKILAALQAGDADAAEHYMHSHLELVAQDLISMTRDGNVSL